MKESSPAIIIHAGAGPLLKTLESEKRAHEGLKSVCDQAYQKLIQGESAVDVVTWAVSQLEDNPQFNAGTGCMLQSDGVARMSASLMDGNLNRFSGVVNIEEVKNPILISKVLQKENDRVISGEGAKRYAHNAGFPVYNPITEKSYSEWKDRKEKTKLNLETVVGTVGAVCVDKQGRLAAATSTGGKGMEIVGRVSDTPTIAGNYASNHAAVSATGIGEELVEIGMGVRIVTRVDDGQNLEEAFSKTFSEFKKRNGRGGAIGVDRHGNICAQFTTPCMLHAFKTGTSEYVYPEKE